MRRVRSALVAMAATAAAVAAVIVPLTFGAGSAAAVSPAVSNSHYIRDLSYDNAANNPAVMQSVACNDAEAPNHSTVTVLHLGAQSITSPLSRLHRGILLSATSTRLTYRQLMLAIEGYIAGFHACRAGGAPFLTLAVATNNDGANYSTYTAIQKADDFVNGLVAPLRKYVVDNHLSAEIGVVGAIDIEAGFASTLSQAQQWEAEYLKKTPATLFYTGSADACPTVGTNRSCGSVKDSANHTKTWTQANYVSLTSNGTRIKVLPQIYVSGQASQWSHIDLTSRTSTSTPGRLIFVGSLTEHAACGDACSFTPTVGWNNLATALGNVEAKVPGTAATDLNIAD